MAKPIKVGINGFGRIGRNLFKLLFLNKEIEVVAINDLADAATLSHLLKYDSIHGIFPHKISAEKSEILINERRFPILNCNTPESINWKIYNVDIVLECSGKFKTETALIPHIKNGAKKVILSAPPQDDSIKMAVLGVNDQLITANDKIVSNASCTTNNAAPMLKIIDDLLGVEQAYITTVHSYTSDQNTHDKPHKDLRRARAAAQSIIPTTTGAAKALTKVFPHLEKVIGGCGIRVPVANGSLTDMTLNVKQKINIEEVNNAFKNAAENKFKGLIQYTEDPIVSVDILGNPHSVIFDSLMTSVIGEKLVKIIGWYDNEIGYSNRLVELIYLIYKK